jgi:hypothetical protein
LTSRNERKKKEKKGLEGAVRGRQTAALDAAGAGWGSAAMLSFAACVWVLANYGPWISLGHRIDRMDCRRRRAVESSAQG